MKTHTYVFNWGMIFEDISHIIGIVRSKSRFKNWHKGHIMTKSMQRIECCDLSIVVVGVFSNIFAAQGHMGSVRVLNYARPKIVFFDSNKVHNRQDIWTIVIRMFSSC